MIYDWKRLGWLCYETMILDAVQSAMGHVNGEVLGSHRRVIDRVIRLNGVSCFYRSKFVIFKHGEWSDVEKFDSTDREMELGRVRLSRADKSWEAVVWGVEGRLFSLEFSADPLIRSCDGLNVEVLSVWG